MRRLPALALLACLLPLGGCYIYFGDDDDDQPPCDDGARPYPDTLLRNPVTGQCESFGGGGGGWGCDVPVADGDDGNSGGGSVGGGSGVPTPTDPSTGTGDSEADPAFPGGAWPDWGYCSTYCDALDEESCKAADGCRAAYVDTCPFCDIFPPQHEYVGCWATAQSGPIRGGGCQGLDAQECSRHDDCSAVHWRLEAPGEDGGFTNAYGEFMYCYDEGPVMPPVECSTLGESECIGRGDCTPLYSGDDCSCDAMGGCTCQTWTFEQCVDGDGGGGGGGGGGSFQCGNAVCGAGQFCSITYPGIPGGSTSYSCEAIPMICYADPAISVCECLKTQSNTCLQTCEIDAAGNVTTQCFAP